MKKALKTLALLLVIYAVGGALLDQWIFPEPPPDGTYFPPVGYVFASETEGFDQRILKRQDGLFWIELTLRPNVPGPPEHIHASFREKFLVAEGTLSLLADGKVRELGPSESFLIRPGVPHKPFNQTGEPVVVRGPFTEEYGIREPFSVFLTQAYGFFDEDPANNQAPRALLQMSRFSPRYDSWMAGPPLFAQRLLFHIIGPTARLLGYRAYYRRFAPPSGTHP